MLLSTAGATAVLHTLIPDHWLPFVLIGRARGWAPLTTAMISGVSAVIHVLLSIALGLVALGVGLKAAEAIGESLERSGAALLVAFGVAYAVWAWRKGGHFHPGGAMLHADSGEGCRGGEGPGNPDHLHYHADAELIRGRPGWGALGMALIVGLNPCILVLPLMLEAQSRAGILAVSLAYGLPTVLLIVILSALGVAGGRRIRLPGMVRHMELASGVLIAVLGVVIWLVEG
jgi:ABC-type nickel/cobalt efflux system permease component RcnA